jgi:hypothetical protein
MTPDWFKRMRADFDAIVPHHPIGTLTFAGESCAF